MRITIKWSATAALCLLGMVGCSSDSGEGIDDQTTGCEGDKCDTPNDTNACFARLEQLSNMNNGALTPDELSMCTADAEKMCQDRGQQIIRGNQQSYTPTALRWSCADVAGVSNNNRDDRGQEYCEYFAIVKAPGAAAPTVLGREGKPPGINLTADQKGKLDDLGDAEVGKCVFTSWHEDVPGPIPACASADNCPKVAGVPIDTATFRMQDSVNSNNAAFALIKDCLDTTPPSAYADDFQRGCMMTYQLYRTEWRKSDPTICAAAMRLTECGCDSARSRGLDPDNRAKLIARTLIPKQDGRAGSKVTLRGFPLGTWTGMNALPAGCEYVSTGVEASGAESHTIVQCKLTANDLLTFSGDMKEQCRKKYGENVVVHVPVPQALVAQATCTPPDGKTCSATPWVVAAAPAASSP
jgi:hypothetical protein